MPWSRAALSSLMAAYAEAISAIPSATASSELEAQIKRPSCTDHHPPSETSGRQSSLAVSTTRTCRALPPAAISSAFKGPSCARAYATGTAGSRGESPRSANSPGASRWKAGYGRPAGETAVLIGLPQGASRARHTLSGAGVVRAFGHMDRRHGAAIELVRAILRNAQHTAGLATRDPAGARCPMAGPAGPRHAAQP